MTHLSDFSYLERCSINIYISIYLFYVLWTRDQFQCLRLSKIIGGELKSVITVMMIVMMTTQAVYDAVSTAVKYQEGFMVNPLTGTIITKPFDFWSPQDQAPILAIDYVECVTFSFQTGVFFLLQCFWNYLSNTVAKKSFMGSWEFKFYIVWALGSMAMMPILQWTQRNSELLREVVPQFAYGLEVLITACLGVRSHFRFKRIIAQTSRSNNASSTAITNKLNYFKEMNLILTVVLFSYAASWIILCSDGLTSAMYINTHKFAADFVIGNANTCVFLLWLLFIAIFHPSQNFGDSVTTHKRTIPETRDEEEDRDHKRISMRVTNFTEKNFENQTVDESYVNSGQRDMSLKTFQTDAPLITQRRQIEDITTFTMGSMRESEAGQSSPTLPPDYTINQKIPLHTLFTSGQPNQINGGRNSPSTQYGDEVSEYSNDVRRYLGDESLSQIPARPLPPARGNSQRSSNNPNHRSVAGSSSVASSGKDWLWQSPDRRNL